MKETRRKFSAAFKAEVSLEAIRGVKTIIELVQEYQVHPVQINTWKKIFLERTANIFEGDKKQEQELKKLREDCDELFRQIAELKVENSWYKKTQVMNPDDKLKLIDPSCSQLSVSRQCRLWDLSRSRFYYKPKGIDQVELEQMRILDELYLEDPTRGTRRMNKELKKLGYQAGRHHTRTLMQRMRLKTVYCRPRTTIIDKTSYKYPYLLRNLKVKRVNQVWAVDITYIPMDKGFLYLFAVMDLRSRCIVGWSLSNTMEADWVISTLKQASAQHGKPEIINSDQGSQFTSKGYIDYIKSLESTKISMDGKGREIDNVFIERFWRTIKYDKLYLYTIENGHHALELCEEFIEYYNYKRMHSSINDKTPMQIYKEAA